MGQKDRPRAVETDERAFLAEMRGIGGDLRQIARPAASPFSFEPVDPAGPGAQRATFEKREGALDSFGKQPGAVGPPIGRLKIPVDHFIYYSKPARSGELKKGEGPLLRTAIHSSWPCGLPANDENPLS